VVVPVQTDQVASFERDGLLFPIDLKTPDEAAAIRREWDAFETREGLPASRERFLYNRHGDQTFIWQLASDPILLDAVEPLIGPNILLFGTRVICKWPGDGDFVAWHQDLSKRNQLHPPVQITAWYAIDDVDEANGCVRCIPGSHRAGMREREPASHDGNLLRINEHTPVSREMASRAVPIRLRAGQVSLHHGFTLHTSGRNESTRRRCGLVIRYVPAYVTQGSGVEVNQRETAIVVRGVDEHGAGRAPSSV
jgi:non-heme Fe2+,alpha-ketoglutarate-dependent halogenase